MRTLACQTELTDVELRKMLKLAVVVDRRSKRNKLLPAVWTMLVRQAGHLAACIEYIIDL